MLWKICRDFKITSTITTPMTDTDEEFLKILRNANYLRFLPKCRKCGQYPVGRVDGNGPNYAVWVYCIGFDCITGNETGFITDRSNFKETKIKAYKQWLKHVNIE